LQNLSQIQALVENTNQSPRIAAVAGAFPKHYYRQEQIAAALRRHWTGRVEDEKALDRLLSRVGVEGRHLALPILAAMEPGFCAELVLLRW